jgi:hypothetical protein
VREEVQALLADVPVASRASDLVGVSTRLPMAAAE